MEMKPGIRYRVTKASKDKTFQIGDQVRIDDGGDLILYGENGGWIDASDLAKATHGWEIAVDREWVQGRLARLREQVAELEAAIRRSEDFDHYADALPIAEAALKAADVPKMQARIAKLEVELESHRRIYTRSDNDVAMVNALLDGSRQANSTLRARIAELEAAIAAIRGTVEAHAARRSSFGLG